MPAPYLPLHFDRMPIDAPYVITTQYGAPSATVPPHPHMGADLWSPKPKHWPVYAPARGRVVAFTNDGSFGGSAICLDHEGTEWYSLYAHLDSALVAVGDLVESGQQIGWSGFKGTVRPPNSDGEHVHWQVCKSTQFPIDLAQNADPLSFLRASADDTPATVSVPNQSQFMRAVARGISAPDTPWVNATLMRWAHLESPDPDSDGNNILFEIGFNPIATTFLGRRSSKDIGFGPGKWNTANPPYGVGLYADFDAGVEATAATLLNGNFEDVLTALREQRPNQDAYDDLKRYIGNEGYAQDLLDFLHDNGASKDLYPDAKEVDLGISQAQFDSLVKDHEDLLMACFSGGEEVGLTREQHLANARYRIGTANQCINDVAISAALDVAKLKGENPTKPADLDALLTQAVSQLRIVRTGS